MMNAQVSLPPDDRAWMLQFLRWNIPTTFLFACVNLGLFALTMHPTFLFSGVITLVYGCLLLWSRTLARHGKLSLAAGLVGGGLAVLTIGTIIHVPSLWPMALLLNVLAAVIVLPYLRPVLSQAYFIGTWVLCILLMVMAEWVRIIPEQLPFLPLIQLITIGSVLGFMLFILWQYHARLTVLINRIQAANGALRIAQASLEAEVATRTHALSLSETQARANAELYRTLIQSLSDTAVLMYDRELRYVVAEGPLLERIGLPLEQLVGQPVTVVWPAEHAGLMAERYRQVLDGASDVREEQRDGRALQVHTVPVRDGNGIITAGVAIYHDVTERKAAEQTLRDERDFAVTLTATMSEGLSVTGANGRYEYVNPAFARMTGHRPEALIGRPVSEFTPPDEHERLQGILAHRSTGSSSSYEMRIRHADGHELYTLISGVPRFRDGKYTGNIAVIRDLTEHRQMEQARQDEHDFALSVMNTVGQGLLVTDANGQYEFVNPALALMLGYTREQMVGRRTSDFTFPEDWPQLARNLHQLPEATAGSYELRLRRADGSEVYGLVTATPRLRDGRFAGTIAVVTDLTERKRLEAAMAYARDEAITASRLKSEFLANMSHELRTPLNGVIGMSDLLSLTDLTDEQRRYVELVRTCGTTLLALISDILDFSRIEAGKLELLQQPFDPRTCVRAAVSMVAYLAAEKGLSLQLTIGDTVPPTLLGDATRLQQVLTNLLSNAVKFTQQGVILLTLSCQPEVKGRAYELLCVVKDTGIGIPQERLNAIFEPFVQVDASTTRNYGGTGLGLAICRRLITLMNGAIWAESEVGRGSSFTFTCLCEPAPGVVSPHVPG